MKKINKISSCLLSCTILSTITFTSVSATKQRMFLFDEELTASKSEGTPTTEAAPQAKEPPPEAQVKQLTMKLETVESLQEKEQEFCLLYRRILEKEGSRIDDIHMLKYDIFLYLKTLRIQSYKYPTIISDMQIFEFFLDLVREFNKTPLPRFDRHDYRLRFDPRWGGSGAIVCSPEDNPHNILAVL